MKAARNRTVRSVLVVGILLILICQGCGLVQPAEPWGTMAVTGKFFEHLYTWQDPDLAIWLAVLSPVLFPLVLVVDGVLMPFMVPYDVYQLFTDGGGGGE